MKIKMSPSITLGLYTFHRESLDKEQVLILSRVVGDLCCLRVMSNQGRHYAQQWNQFF